MTKITWINPTVDANSSAQQIEDYVREHFTRAFAARGIDRPDIADAFAARLREIVQKWDAEEVVAIDVVLSAEGGLPDQFRLPLERAVSRLKAHAVVKIAEAFISAGETGVAAAFEHAPPR